MPDRTDKSEPKASDATKPAADKPPKPAVYSAEDLQAGADQFGTTAAGMAGALHLAGLTEATHEQAQKAVNDFNEREV